MSTFHNQIRATLEQRDLLIPPLTALAAEMPNSWGQRDVQELIDLLRNETDVQAWLQHPRAAAWLPVIVGGFSPAETPHRIHLLFAQTMRQQQRQQGGGASLLYPFLILALTGVVGLGLSWAIVPTFAAMYRDFDLQLPLPTRFAVSISDRMIQSPLRQLMLAAGMIVLGFAIYRWWLDSPLCSQILSPKGSTRKVQAMAQAVGSVAELINVGASIPEALRISGRGCGHPLYKRELESLATAAENSTGALNQRSEATYFPANLLLALQPNDAGLPNIHLLRELSLLYHERGAQRIDWLRWLVGPLALVAVALVVGFVVIALFMPLISLVTSLG
ncbi:type IV pilin biogenesis protein [Rosistilla carotiformis]|uniref:Type IV pilin biogenesis protein n=1 Tax=Rosistilla carotiformis TaxID=2528017 RepID=A0A518JQN3_9BACT|nr:type II secretion system F family protein [Rosistilla carotiformis]QDV67838.1 type IV pilin biogenesis protein [Rosistilla carotiformis]